MRFHALAGLVLSKSRTSGFQGRPESFMAMVSLPLLSVFWPQQPLLSSPERGRASNIMSTLCFLL